MKILEQLTIRVTNLLTRLETLRSENDDLHAQVDALKETIRALEAKTQRLTDALAEEDALRTQAISHIDRLLQALQDFDGDES